MDGIAGPASAPVFIDVIEDGKPKRYTMSPMTLGDFAAIEQEFMRKARTPMDAIATMIAKLREMGANEDASRIIDRAYKDTIEQSKTRADRPSVADVQAYIETFEGVVFTVWLCFKKHHPSITKERVLEIIQEYGLEQIKKDRDQVAGIDSVGNVIGSAATATATVPSGPTDPSHGDASTENSPTVTSGHLPL